jgi:hypothetical protein
MGRDSLKWQGCSSASPQAPQVVAYGNIIAVMPVRISIQQSRILWMLPFPHWWKNASLLKDMAKGIVMQSQICVTCVVAGCTRT